MAGAGFKTFNTGDVLTASDVNTYLMQQTVMVFADSSARSTALGANVAEGMLSYLKDTNATEVYDGSSWVGIGNSGDITGVTAGTGISGGGSSGTVTITNSMATAIDAKGDLIAGTGSDTFDRLAVGTNGHVLTADSSTTTGLKWAAASGGGEGWVQVATGSLTSGSSLQLSGLTTYDKYLLTLSGLKTNAAAALTCRINNDSTTKYRGRGWYIYGTASLGNSAFGTYASDATDLTEGVNVGSTTSANNYTNSILITGCKSSTDFKKYETILSSHDGTYRYQVVLRGIYIVSTALSTLDIALSTSSFTAGTYYLYGSN